LTADTMTCDSHGTIRGKPADRDDALAQIRSARNKVITGTAFCLEKRIWRAGAWHTEKRIERYAEGTCWYIVPDAWLETYLAQPFIYSSAGTIFVEGFGTQFVKEVHGSYSAIMGQPMFELRQALEEIGFY
jgi:septum formation protein